MMSGGDKTGRGPIRNMRKKSRIKGKAKFRPKRGSDGPVGK